MSEWLPVILEIVKALFPFHKLGLNALDFVLLFIIIFYAFEGFMLGLLMATIDLVSFILSFALALKFYTVVSGGMVTVFSLPIGIANALSFFLIALIAEIILSILLRKIM